MEVLMAKKLGGERGTLLSDAICMSSKLETVHWNSKAGKQNKKMQHAGASTNKVAKMMVWSFFNIILLVYVFTFLFTWLFANLMTGKEYLHCHNLRDIPTHECALLGRSLNYSDVLCWMRTYSGSFVTHRLM